jgi:hypothetical protein
VASRAALFVFVPAALVFAGRVRPTADRAAHGLPWRRWAASAAVVAIALAAVWMLHGPLLAAWHANMGAVEYARIDLADWPRNQWSSGQEAPALAATRPNFVKALSVDAGNRTAHHRLGLLARLERDFETAATELQAARDVDPNHWGINKPLGLTYVWLGDFERAEPLLRTVGGVSRELEVYAWWWGTQQRADLAAFARHMAARLPR